MRTKLLLILLSFTLSSCGQTKMSKDDIIEKYVTNGSAKVNYVFWMDEYQAHLDQGIKIDSSIAYLWQQKAMPYFKAKKYELGMQYLDKAVQLDPEGWLSYRAFIKCIFSKTYKDAITDFETCKKMHGNAYVMDHTYDFYMAISYLQLNEFNKAEILLAGYLNDLEKELGKEWLHPTALFYLGIAKKELHKYDEAILEFDKALVLYPEFSDVKFYKSLCLYKLKRKVEAQTLFKEYQLDSENGFSINEDNAVYETYPYQKKQ